MGYTERRDWGWRITADWRSFLRHVMDIFLFRLLYFAELPGSDRERSIRLKGDVVLTYRLNRGDIQGIREVWVHQIWRPPVDLGPVTNVVDLGANIGFTGVYFARRLGCERLIAVEPDDRNVQLAARNFKANGVEAQLLPAAVGPRDGVARFAATRQSNLGRVADSGVKVEMVSVPSLLEKLPKDSEVNLLKIDIEGSEDTLLRGNRNWLCRVRAVMAEFHPTVVDPDELVALLQCDGFRFIPADSVWSTDTFVRDAAGGWPLTACFSGPRSAPKSGPPRARVMWPHGPAGRGAGPGNVAHRRQGI